MIEKISKDWKRRLRFQIVKAYPTFLNDYIIFFPNKLFYCNDMQQSEIVMGFSNLNKPKK